MLVEDVNGNYNFQPSLAVEYLVAPNDQANSNLSTVTLFNVGSLSQYSQFSYPEKVVFYSPSSQSGGYWMLKLQRDNLNIDPNCGAIANQAKQQTDVPACGTFYATGSQSPATATKAYQSLAAALNAIAPDDLVFLVTVGPGWLFPEPKFVGCRGHILHRRKRHPTKRFLSGVRPCSLKMWAARLRTTLSLYVPGSAYTLVTCRDCGNSLNGHAVLSASGFTQQGETGFVHGLLRRNLNGFYWPGQTSQESQSQSAAGGGADFTMSLVGSQQPVEWPELSGAPLSGASSVAGQVAAYHYLSYQLVTQYYIRGAQGNYLDDIHYYFTGANNTYIDYHTFYPANLPFPGQPGSCYVWTDPVTNTALTCFTQQDLFAVAQQVSTEVVDLDNVLQFMVNGSTNMKDTVATGNGSAALALIGQLRQWKAAICSRLRLLR